VIIPEEEEENHSENEETTRRFSPRVTSVPRKVEAVSISAEDRRLLLRKLFSGRTRG